MNREQIRLYKKRKVLYWLFTISLVLLWYGVTDIESFFMGLHPLTRRAPIPFEFFLFIGVIGGFVALQLWYKRCPVCKNKMKWSGLSPLCTHCGFGNIPPKNWSLQ